MKTATVKFIGEEVIVGLQKGNTYTATGTETLGTEKKYIVIDDENEAYLFDPEVFEVVSDPDNILKL